VAGPYGVVTLHRPSNVDDPVHLRGLLSALTRIATDLPLIFPIHPRTAAALERDGTALSGDRLRLIPPLGYVDFLHVLAHARLVITDSGGIQEETTILEVPCLTVRDTTERPVTVDCGWNRLVGTRSADIVTAARAVLRDGNPTGRRPALWDGGASRRILDILEHDWTTLRDASHVERGQCVSS
jgi:UDP-N-acetylglucosamine 2-epimerase (non-hydrolysing)